jgi:arylsulfatase A-like enzyme
MSEQPNFLLFITDQHRVDYLGCYGHPLLKTPHIDSIAARGTRFDNFYVATPVCMPNRATLMTGRMPSDSLVIEDEQQRPTLGFTAPPRLRTLITARYRMTIADGDPYCELYDRQNDPHELDNLFDDSAHRALRGELMEKLAYREMELADRSPLPSGRA